MFYLKKGDKVSSCLAQGLRQSLNERRSTIDETQRSKSVHGAVPAKGKGIFNAVLSLFIFVLHINNKATYFYLLNILQSYSY